MNKLFFLSALLFGVNLNVICQTIVQMKRENGVSTIPCRVNGLELSFIFDTGASDVTISLTEARFMLKNGYLNKNDIIGTANYSDAKGEISEGYVINIKLIEFAGFKLSNVKASIVNTLNAPLLLGQTAISKLGKVQLDLNSNTLIILNGKPMQTVAEYEKPNTNNFSDNTKKVFELNYIPTMTGALEQMKTAKTPEENAAVAAKFERIGDAEKTQWLPYYYAALIKARMAFVANDKDKAADEATTLLDKAEALEKNNSEIYCVKATICYAHMMVDPMTRWMQYGADATKNLEAAKKADAANPRPVVLQANSLKNTPEQFGGGCATAKPLAEKAAKLLADFKPTTALHPIWGKEIIDQILESCK